jgi:hypothetical protein
MTCWLPFQSSVAVWMNLGRALLVRCFRKGNCYLVLNCSPNCVFFQFSGLSLSLIRLSLILEFLLGRHTGHSLFSAGFDPFTFFLFKICVHIHFGSVLLNCFSIGQLPFLIISLRGIPCSSWFVILYKYFELCVLIWLFKLIICQSYIAHFCNLFNNPSQEFQKPYKTFIKRQLTSWIYGGSINSDCIMGAVSFMTWQPIF